jgi:hypothetical protein
MGAVHKRNHTAQADELIKLRELFAENPKDLWRLARRPARRWEVAAEFMDLDLVPRSDPNVPSQIHRIMQATALFTMATNPAVLQSATMPLDVICRHVISVANMGDPDELVPQKQPDPPPPPDPKAIAAMQKAQNDQQKNQLQAQKLQADATDTRREAAAQAVEAEQRQKDRDAEQQIEQMKLTLEREKLAGQHAREVGGLVLDHAHRSAGLAQDHAQHKDNLALDAAKHVDTMQQQADQQNFGGDTL